MSISSGLRERYRHLYRRLKAEVVDALEEARPPQTVKKEIIRIVSNFPHPEVASVRDILEVCRECVSGKLEYLYRRFGEEAKAILNEIRVAEGQYGRPPVPSERYEVRDAVNMLAWTNRTLYDMTFALDGIKKATDIILKGQCPFCHGDLVMAIFNDELRLRCKSRTNTNCRKVDWYVGKVSPTSPP